MIEVLIITASLIAVTIGGTVATVILANVVLDLCEEWSDKK